MNATFLLTAAPERSLALQSGTEAQDNLINMPSQSLEHVNKVDTTLELYVRPSGSGTAPVWLLNGV